MQDGEVKTLVLADIELVSETDHRITSLLFPSQLPAPLIEETKAFVARVVSQLGFADGALIMDGVVTEEGPQVYEINARMDSGLVVPALEAHLGMPWVAEVLRCSVGEPLSTGCPSTDPGAGEARCVAIELVLSEHAGRLASLHIDPAFASAVTSQKSVGDKVFGPEGAYDCVVTARLEGPSADALVKRRQEFRARLSWCVHAD